MRSGLVELLAATEVCEEESVHDSLTPEHNSNYRCMFSFSLSLLRGGIPDLNNHVFLNRMSNALNCFH